MPDRFPQAGKGKRASILVTTIIVFAFFSVIGLSLIALLYSHITVIQLEIDKLKALYLAEAGVAQAFYEIRVGIDTDSDGLGNLKAHPLGDGKFWVNHDMQTASIISTGEVNRIRRTIQVRYNAI